MAVNKSNLYSLDDCSILHSFAIEIPPAFLPFFTEKTLKSRNYEKITRLLLNLKMMGISPSRFVPCERFDENIMKVADELIQETGISVPFLPKPFKIEVIDSLKRFTDSLTLWNKIKKNANFSDIKKFFQNNERSLKKAKSGRYTNIPEDDDCSILAGLKEFIWTGPKIIITEDEHFWGYDDLIFRDHGITIIKEWECHRLC